MNADTYYMERKELHHDRHTISLLTDYMVITPKYRGKILVGDVTLAVEGIVHKTCKDIPSTGINCAFCMANPTMNAQQPIPTMPIQHDRQHKGFCSLRSRFNAKSQRRRDAKGGVKLLVAHLTDTYAKKLSLWRCEVYED